MLKVGIVVTIIIIATFYYLPLSQGRAPDAPFETIKVVANKIWLKIKSIDISIPKIPQIPKSTPSSSGSVTIYRWKDKTGQWHYSNTPPAQQNTLEHYSSLVLNSNTNIIQSVPPEQKQPDPDTSTEQPVTTPAENDLSNPYSKDAIKKLFNQAESISKNMQDRERVMQDLNQSIR
jgi:hypothetical protein